MSQAKESLLVSSQDLVTRRRQRNSELAVVAGNLKDIARDVLNSGRDTETGIALVEQSKFVRAFLDRSNAEIDSFPQELEALLEYHGLSDLPDRQIIPSEESSQNGRVASVFPTTGKAPAVPVLGTTNGREAAIPAIAQPTIDNDFRLSINAKVDRYVDEQQRSVYKIADVLRSFDIRANDSVRSARVREIAKRYGVDISLRVLRMSPAEFSLVAFDYGVELFAQKDDQAVNDVKPREGKTEREEESDWISAYHAKYPEKTEYGRDDAAEATAKNPTGNMGAQISEAFRQEGVELVRGKRKTVDRATFDRIIRRVGPGAAILRQVQKESSISKPAGVTLPGLTVDEDQLRRAMLQSMVQARQDSGAEQEGVDSKVEESADAGRVDFDMTPTRLFYLASGLKHRLGALRREGVDPDYLALLDRVIGRETVFIEPPEDLDVFCLDFAQDLNNLSSRSVDWMRYSESNPEIGVMLNDLSSRASIKPGDAFIAIVGNMSVGSSKDGDGDEGEGGGETKQPFGPVEIFSIVNTLRKEHNIRVLEKFHRQFTPSHIQKLNDTASETRGELTGQQLGAADQFLTFKRIVLEYVADAEAFLQLHGDSAIGWIFKVTLRGIDRSEAESLLEALH